MKTVRFFWFYFKRYKLSFAVIFLAIIAATYLQVKTPVLLGNAIAEMGKIATSYAMAKQTGVTGFKPDMADFNGVMLNLFFAYVATVVANLIYSLLLTRIVAHSTNRMRKGLFGKLERLTIAFFDRHKDGDILSRFTSDLDNIQNAFNQSMVQILSNGALYIGMVWMMFRQDTRLALVTIASTPVALLALVIIVRLARKYTNLQQAAVSKLNAYMDEKISGQKAIIVQGVQEETIDGFLELNEEVRRTTFKGRLFGGFSSHS